MACRPGVGAEPDPSLGWDGEPFAEATYAWLKKNDPELKLRPQKESFLGESIPAIKLNYGDPSARNRTAPSNGAQPVLAQMKKFMAMALPQDVRNLGETLYAGGDFKFTDSTLYEAQRHLKAWILLQKDESIAPHELLGRAIVEAKGSVEGGLAIAWNLLRENWREAASRNANIIMSKLIDVTGEAHLYAGTGQFVILPEGKGKLQSAKTKIGNETREAKILNRIAFRLSKRGDKFSSYYHFFGVMIMSNYISSRYGAMAGKAAGKGGAVAEALLHKHTSGLAMERIKRISNDKEAGAAGARLYTLVKQNAAPKNLAAESEAYLKPNPRYQVAYQLEKDGRPPAYFGLKTDPKFWNGPMTVEELKLRFQHAVWIDPSVFSAVLMGLNTDGERLQVGLSNYLRNGAGDPELNELISLYHRGARPETYAQVRDGFADYSLDAHNLEKHAQSQFPDFELRKSYYRFKELVDRIADQAASGKAGCQGTFHHLGKGPH